MAHVCPIGGYCPQGATNSTLCPVGTYGVTLGGTSLADSCRPCDAGYYCPGPGTVFSSRYLCPPGAYCPEGTYSIMYCPPGTSSSLVGQASPSTCVECEKGTYCPNYGTQNNGTACPANYYCPQGTVHYRQFPCPEGTYSEATGLHSAAQCSNCTRGYYCPGGMSPLPCAAGTYNPSFGGTSNSSCFPCEAGFACPTAGMVVMTHQCAPGHYCPPGTINPNQYSCPAGTYSDSTSLTSQSQCPKCPAGYTCQIAATQVDPCRPGFYCPEGVASGHDIPCPSGRFSGSAQLTGASECSLCTAGKFCLGGNKTESGVCPAGHYCPLGTNSSTQFPCPAGTYSSQSGLYSVTQCLTCQAGYFCDVASTQMTSCPAGTYSTSAGTSTTSCVQCRGGYYCPRTSSLEIPCGVGYYSAPGSSNCTVCPRGHYCGSNTTSFVQLTSDGGSWSRAADPSGKCFNGTICALGMNRAPDLLRDACPPGYYCPGM